MNSLYLFKRFVFLFGLFAVVVVSSSSGSEDTASHDSETRAVIIKNTSESSGTVEQYKYGTYLYFSTEPVTVEYHLKNIAEFLGREIYWLFEYGWKARKKQEKIGQLSPLDEEYATIKKEIVDEFQDLKRKSKCLYEHARKNIIEYVDPYQLPKPIAWQFGVLFGLYGNFQKEMALYNLEPLASDFDQELTETAKVLYFYKTSLLFLSYHFGLSNTSPPILQHDNLNAMVSDSGFDIELDILFEKEFYSVDEQAWIQAIQNLEQERLEHLCGLFRSFYRQFLQNRGDHSKFYVPLAAHLSSLTTKILLSAQKNANYHLDAVNPWMFKLYIDLKKWETLQRQDAALVTPDFQTFLPELQKRCMNLLPPGLTLADITEENEFAICEEVRKRNLLPTNQDDLEKGQEILDEFEFSPVTFRWYFIGMLLFFDDRARFARGYQVAFKHFTEQTQQIYNYLSGFVEMSDLPITESNALEYLLHIKLFDIISNIWNSHYHVDYEYFGGIHFGFIGFDQFYFPRTTYELRKYILKLCPNLKSYEALTISVNPDKLREEQDETTPGSWIEEAEKLRQMCIENLLKSAQHLSDLMDQSPLKGIIVGTRGISGAGKSTFLKRNILPLILPEGKSDPEQIDTLVQGVLNPDTIKAALKKLQGDTLNTQIHNEGYNAFQQVFREISEKGGYILDKRQLTPHEIVTNLVEPAKKAAESVWLFDFDISLTACISRILARPLHGDDPCPEYEALIDGFLSVRRHRSQVVELAMREDTIAKYELYATSKQRLIAHKINGEHCPLSLGSAGFLCIHDFDLFDECLKEPTYDDIEAELSQVINDNFIAEAVARGDIFPEQREAIEKWQGMTLKEAIQQHVQGGKGTWNECLFEPAAVSPFNGEEWLEDFPQVIAYLQSEHLLHIRGVDETGRGFHWEAGQVERGLNPKYNPEAKVPGFSQSGIQMKIGYFIVPMDNLDIYLSDNLSPAVARELTVRNENGELIGLRFFVHPEAYAHFAPLLQANVTFVPPSESEFMGTPTSSYNSWLIRRVSSNIRNPFIVKMGTPNGGSDIKHLLAGDDIVKSLASQKYLDTLPDRPDFVLFKETAGIILKSIPGYPAGTVNSGIVICELPEELLKGECKILSLSAVMSCERIKPENRGIAALDGNHAEMHKLPLIYELFEAAIEKGLVKTPEEFLQIYFVDAYLQAIEPIAFKEGYSLVGQGENLHLVLNPDNTIKGFAYRDLGTMKWKKNFLESYSWFYRYVNFIKLLNVVTQSDSDDVPPSLGGPIRAGTEKQSSERNLYRYLCKKLDDEGEYHSLEALNRLSITPEESLKLLKQLDVSYLELLRRYFGIDEAVILNSDGTVPCAEKGSLAEKALRQLNLTLWESRIPEEGTKQSN